MGALTITTLGAPHILHDGAPATFSTRKALALTLYLAVTGRPHSRASLVTLLWPDADEAHGPLNLRQTLLRVRQTLAPDGNAHLRTTGDLVRLDLGLGGKVDVAQLGARQAQTLSEDAQAALHGYAGPFLDHLLLDDAPDFMAWVTAQRAHWGAHYDLIAERELRRLIDYGHADEASALGQAWVAQRPDTEIAYRLLATAQAATGEVSAARLTLATLAQRWGDLSLALAPDTETLRAQLAAQSASPDAASTSLPSAVNHAVRLPFVGRRDAFVQARRAYQQALAGVPGVLLVQGSAGVGKSRLVGGFIHWAEAQGADVAVGHAYELSGHLPYQPLMELLRARLARERAPDDLLEDSWLTELQRLAPDLHDRYPDLPPPVDDAAAGARLLEAIAQLGMALARRRPLLWLVEDLHWADEATRSGLLFLLKRWQEERLPAWVIGTLRTEEVVATPSLEFWLTAAQRSTEATMITLLPLTDEQTTQAVTTLFDATASPEVCAWFFEETQGNPLYLEHVAQALVERGTAAWREDGTLQLSAATSMAALTGWLPETLRELLLQRVWRLDQTTQQTLAAATILGTRFDEALLLPVAGVDENALLTALEAAERSQLIRAEAGQYRFTHDKVAEALYGDLALARRRVYHRRALKALEAGRATPPADLAQHALGAEAWEQAAEYTLQAAWAARQIGAYRDTLRMYEQVLHLLTTSPSQLVVQAHLSEVAQAEFYHTLGLLYLTLGEKEQAHALYARLLTNAQARGAHLLEGRLLFMQGQLMYQYDHDMPGGQRRLEQARQIAQEQEDTAGALLAERMLAMAAATREDLPVAWDYFQQANQRARASHLPNALAQNLLQMGGVARMRGHWEAACAAAEESLVLLARSTTARSQEVDEDAPPYQFVAPLAWSAFFPQIEALAHAKPTRANNHARQWGANALAALGIARLHLGEGAAGRAALELAWRIFTERNERRYQHHFLLYRTLGWMEAGVYERALLDIQQVTEAMNTSLEQPFDSSAFMPPCALVDTYHALFQLAEARAPLGEAVAFSANEPTRDRLAPATRVVTHYALVGEWEAAYTATLQAQALREALPCFLPWFDFARYDETEALLRAGDRDRAQADAERLGAHLDGNRRYRLLYLRMLALLDGDADDHSAGATHLQEALGLAAEMELPGEEWQIAAALATSYIRMGEAQLAHVAHTRAEHVIALLASQITPPALRNHFATSALARLPILT